MTLVEMLFLQLNLCDFCIRSCPACEKFMLKVSVIDRKR